MLYVDGIGKAPPLQHFGFQATVKTQNSIKIAAFKGPHKFLFAKPAKEGPAK